MSVVAVAQEIRGSIQGIVSDSSGAVIPGAQVTLTNNATAVKTTKETSAIGQYVFDFVSAGTYTVRIESDGFRAFEQRNITVQTRDDITVNAALELGAVAETVTVEDSPVAVSFNRTTMDTTIDTKMTNDLPLVSRNPFMFAQLNPAVNYTGGVENSPYHHWAASQMDVGGNTSQKNDVLVDGSSQLVGAKSTYTPPMDAVSEVSVQQNAVDAEFGHSAGGIIAVQMKSGTNDWHGTGYYFGRNPRLNARPNSTTPTASAVRNHTWGVTSQNPIIKNKLFNFTAYEASKLSEPRTQKYSMPTQAQRDGDFSQLFLGNGNLRTVYDPLTSAFDAASNKAPRQPFAGNIVPGDRLDPTAKIMMGDMWLPNNSDDITGANNWVVTGPMAFDYWNFTDRVDYNVNDSVKIFGRVSIFRTDQTEPNVANSPAIRKSGSTRDTVQFQGDVVWTVNPSTVVNVRGSYSKINDSFFDADALIDGYDKFWPGNPWYESYTAELPQIYYPGLDVRGATRSRFGRDGFWYQEPKTWNMQGKVSKNVGRHYVKMGIDFRQQRVRASRPRPMGYRFDRDETANDGLSPNTATSGAAWASMLLGLITESSRIQQVPLNLPRSEFYGLFVQDDFKINQRVTLNLGLRYEYETALKDPQRRLSRYLDLTNPIPELQGAGAPVMPDEVNAIRNTPPVYNGAWIFTDDDHPGAWNPEKTLFLPRAGIAIRVNDKTALRIGYARYAVPSIQIRDGDVQILGSTPYPGFDAISNALSVQQGIPRSYLNNPFPTSGANANPLVPPTQKSSGRYTNLGGGSLWFRPDFKTGKNERINITLQRQLPARFVMDATWFMNFGYDHANAISGNENLPNLTDPRYGFENGAAVAKTVANPFLGIMTPETFPGPLRNIKTVSVNSLLSPFPQYQTLEQSPAGNISNRYYAIQLMVQRDFANGFNMIFGYNYNRGRDQDYFDNQDRFDDRLTWYDSFTNRQKVSFGSIYELPFGRGKKWGNNWNSVADGILGGWSVSGIFIFRSGQLLQFAGEDLVNGDPRIDNPTRARWFDTSLFAKLPAYTRRSNPRQYDGLYGPGYTNVDMTVQKTWKIKETLQFEVRMEAYNLSNSFMGANPSTSRTASTFGVVNNQLTTAKGREFQYSGRFRW